MQNQFFFTFSLIINQCEKIVYFLTSLISQKSCEYQADYNVA